MVGEELNGIWNILVDSLLSESHLFIDVPLILFTAGSFLHIFERGRVRQLILDFLVLVCDFLK